MTGEIQRIERLEACLRDTYQWLVQNKLDTTAHGRHIAEVLNEEPSGEKWVTVNLDELKALPRGTHVRFRDGSWKDSTRGASLLDKVEPWRSRPSVYLVHTQPLGMELAMAIPANGRIWEALLPRVDKSGEVT